VPDEQGGFSLPFGAITIVASNAPVYIRRLLLVSDRLQPPVIPGEPAPGFLSRLRRLLLPAGREKSITAPPAGGCDFSLFLFLRHVQNSIHIVFGGAQVNHFCPCLLVSRIQFSLL